MIPIRCAKFSINFMVIALLVMPVFSFNHKCRGWSVTFETGVYLSVLRTNF